MRPEDRDHARVINNIKASHTTVERIAQWLIFKGYPTIITPTAYAATYDERLNCVDKGDLYISTKQGALRVEVKQLSTAFTCKEDWKFKDQAIVCAKHSFDKASPKPHMYILVSADKIHAMFVYSDTKDHWIPKQLKDSRYENMTQYFYVCPTEHIHFGRIDG